MDKLDPVTLEVIRNALPAIANEMAADLQRTSYNMMIFEVHDFCTVLVDIHGKLICQNVGGVSHFMADMGVLIDDAMARFGAEGFAPGDVVITNHQAVAGQHLNNIVIYTPLFFHGELLMFAMVRAHWIDVGGTSTGFGNGNARDPWEEGLQLDQIKIYEGGKLDEKIYKILRDNIRFPESSLGDMRSQIAACKLGTRRMEELLEKYSRDTVLACIQQIFDETEQKCRNAVRQFKDGFYEAESFVTDKRGEKLRVHARVTVDGDDLGVDLSGSASATVHDSLNSRTLAGARVAYKALTGPMEPVNEGGFRALKVVVPEGNIMMAPFATSMVMWSSILPTVCDVILRAMAPAMPDHVPAGHHALVGGAVVFFGNDPKTGRRFIVQSVEGGGWGGRPHGDGAHASVSICQGDVRNGSIEGIELKCPVLVEARRLVPDSGGAGKYRGGLGLDMQVRNLVEGRWNLDQPRRRADPPWGLWGGKAGGIADYLVRRPGENAFKSEYGFGVPVPVGTSVITRTGGGGGWGNPFERDPEAVRWDVIEDLVSLENAQTLYGVALNPDLTIDSAATAALRARAGVPGQG
jgi:N-methylhydantoinase B